jgi:hypothetical protein
MIIEAAVTSSPSTSLPKMLRSEHCLARADRLRMFMLTASDPAAAIRLRGFVANYRLLAEQADQPPKQASRSAECF